MNSCACSTTHRPRTVVLTGGPGAGKTAVLELIRKSFCEHVMVLPEAAGIVFGGGFPRNEGAEGLQAAQRAIFYVQRELEAVAVARRPAVVLCDRGTVDGAAYWPGPGDMWTALGTTLDEQMRRYDAVIHLRTPPDEHYNLSNPLRHETGESARTLDGKIALMWKDHPRRFVVESNSDFIGQGRRDSCAHPQRGARVLPATHGRAPRKFRAHNVMKLPANDTTAPPRDSFPRGDRPAVLP